MTKKQEKLDDDGEVEVEYLQEKSMLFSDSFFKRAIAVALHNLVGVIMIWLILILGFMVLGILFGLLAGIFGVIYG